VSEREDTIALRTVAGAITHLLNAAEAEPAAGELRTSPGVA
jgi:hypothetical protein